MIPKSGHHFSEKDRARNKGIERDGESNKNHPALEPYSGSMPAAFTISAHFWVSEITNWRHSSGVLLSGSMPAFNSASCTALSASAAVSAAFNLPTIASGVFAGAKAAN